MGDVGLPMIPGAAEKIGWKQWALRFFVGLISGAYWAAIVSLAWVGLVVVAYGSLDGGLDEIKPHTWVPVAFGGFFASVPASFFAGLVAPLALGRVPLVRRPILLCSALGGALATLASVPLGLLAGWVSWQLAPESMLCAWFTLGLSLPIGVTAGLLAAILVSGGNGVGKRKGKR